MKTSLVDAIDENTLKTLAKRLLRVLRDRDQNTTSTLMSVQEDLARAVGHKDMHAAQAYWDLGRANTVEQKALDASEATKTKDRDAHRALFQLATSKVAKIPVGEEALPDNETMRDKTRKIAEAVCDSGRVLDVIEGDPSARKSFAVNAVVQAYRKAGYNIIPSGKEWQDTRLLTETLSMPSTSGRAIDPLLKEQQVEGYGFSKNTLVVVENAGNLSREDLVSLLKATENKNHDVKVVLLSSTIRPGSALDLLFNGLPVFLGIRLNRDPNKRTSIPYDPGLDQRLREAREDIKRLFDPETEQINQPMATTFFASIASYVNDQGDTGFKKRCYQLFDSLCSSGSPFPTHQFNGSRKGGEIGMDGKQAILTGFATVYGKDQAKIDALIDVLSRVGDFNNAAPFNRPIPYEMAWDSPQARPRTARP